MTEGTLATEAEVLGFPIPWLAVPRWGERFGVVAGVTGRGAPEDPFDLGLASEQPTARVLDRWRQVRSAFPSFSGIVVARQVHEATVRWHDRADGWTIHEGADGHATGTAGLLLAVSLADCVPIYLVDPRRRAIALLHSGWRGTAANMLASGVRALAAHAGSEPADLVGHIGVGICGRCYQVGSDVASACGAEANPAGPTNLDLRAAIARQARELGIDEVTVSEACSAHDRDRFMSHRASGGRDGRMLALLGVIAP